MYVCGMTVQDRPHMGHMLAFVSADLIRRSLENLGYEVLHVQNFTDIDDKIIAKANESGQDPAALAQENIDRFFAAADALKIKRAQIYPKVTEHIEEIQAYIVRLIEAGHAYESGGSVWFEVRSWPQYGELSGRRIEDLESGYRIEVDANKRDPLDFALWKASKEGEPAWDSPWGKGRPGWHIECSVMSTKYLGECFDLHGGGRDLIFPHHENEVAQSKSLGGRFVRYWMHNGLLNLQGQKMSKSTGHFFAMDEVLAEFPAEVVRFYLLRGHFRNQMEYGRERMLEAQAAYDRMARALAKLEELQRADDLGAELQEGIQSKEGIALQEAAQRAREGFGAGLCDDFNAEAAMAALFELVRQLNTYLLARPLSAQVEEGPLRAVRAVLRESLAVLGLFEEFELADEIPPEIAEMLLRRDEARRERDWALADSLRDEIQARGYQLEDTPQGSSVRRATGMPGSG
jgi:cysteinyl-tRNA synthetase